MYNTIYVGDVLAKENNTVTCIKALAPCHYSKLINPLHASNNVINPTYGTEFVQKRMDIVIEYRKRQEHNDIAY